MRLAWINFIGLFASLVLVPAAHAQMNSQMQANGIMGPQSSSKFGMILGVDYLSNFHQKESAESEGNLNGNVGLTYRAGDHQFILSLSYTKELENLREDQVNDLSLVITGFNKKISDQTMFIGNLVGVIALSEEATKVNYFQGAIAVPMIINHQSTVDWLSYQLYLRGTLNSHEFEQNFNGESNQQFNGSFGGGVIISFSDQMSLMTRYRISQGISYEGERFNPVSGYEAILNYMPKANMFLSLGVITRVALYNDQSRLQPAERLFSSSDSLITSGITLMF